MNEVGSISDVADDMDKREFQQMGELLNNEFPQLTEKQIARKLAEDQTYYLTRKEAEVALRAIENRWHEFGIADEDRPRITLDDLLLGTRTGAKLYAEHFQEIHKYYKELVDSGMSGKDAGEYISKAIFGSP